MADADKQTPHHPHLSGKTSRRLIGTIFSIAIFFFLGRYLFKTWHFISWTEVHFRFKYLGLSFVALLVSFCLSVYAWKTILRSLGTEIKMKTAIWTFAGTTLSKYIPGNIWIVGSRIYLCNEKGIAKSIAGIAVLLEMLVTVVAGLWVFIGILPLLVIWKVPSQFWLLSCLLPITVVIIFPNFFFKLLPGLLMRRLPAATDLKISSVYLIIATLLYVVVFFAQGTGLWLLINSVYAFPRETFVPTIGLQSGSWVLGFLTFITPSGLGVREGLLSYFLKFYMPLPLSIIVSFLARLWGTFFEIVATLFAFILRK